MTFDEFCRQLEDVSASVNSAGNLEGAAVGNTLKNKNSVLKSLEILSQGLLNSQWNTEDSAAALNKLLELRGRINSDAAFESIQAQLGQVLSEAAGAKSETGGVYSKQGFKASPAREPASRIDRTF